MLSGLARIRQAGMVSIGTALLAIARVAGSLAVTKSTAILVGPAGLALLGAFQNFTAIALALCSGGLNGGIVRTVAAADDEQSRRADIAALMKVTMITTATTIVAVLMSLPWLTPAVLGSFDHAWVMLVFCALAFGLALNTALLHVLVGCGRRADFLLVNLIASLLTAAVAFPMVRVLGVAGALLVAPLANSAVVVATIGFVRRQRLWVPMAQGRLDRSFLRKLAGFPLMGLASASFLPLAQLAVRDRLVESSTIEIAGIWQGVVKISDAYMMIVTYVVLLLVLPRFSNGNGATDRFRRVASAAMAVAVFAGALAAPAYLFRDLLIRLLFSDEFVSMRELLGPQVLGDVLRSAVLVAQAAFTALVATAAYIAIEATLAFSFVAFSYLLIPQYGAHGVVLAWFLAAALAAVASTFLLLRSRVPREPGALRRA